MREACSRGEADPSPFVGDINARHVVEPERGGQVDPSPGSAGAADVRNLYRLFVSAGSYCQYITDCHVGVSRNLDIGCTSDRCRCQCCLSGCLPDRSDSGQFKVATNVYANLLSDLEACRTRNRYVGRSCGDSEPWPC